MKKLAIVTSTRADYGLLSPVIARFFARGELSVEIIATGTHISDGTASEITNDGYRFHTIDIMKFPQDRSGIARITALTMELFIDCFEGNRPDGLLILGDRYEIYAVATAARFLNIPIFHISGGDVTSGAIDDCLRHCITKLSSIHFPSCERYARRLVSLGEQPDTIYNVGGLGDENIRSMQFLSKDKLSDSLRFDIDRDYLLVTYHPETLSSLSGDEQLDALLSALNRYDGAIIITGANADADGERFNERLKAFCDKEGGRFYIRSMGALRYLSAMKYATAVVGNSSSGVCETPSFGVPTVNIGNRQKGRLIAKNIICCDINSNDIFHAVTEAVSGKFIESSKAARSPYQGENTADDIARITAKRLNEGICSEKEFFDVT